MMNPILESNMLYKEDGTPNEKVVKSISGTSPEAKFSLRDTGVLGTQVDNFVDQHVGSKKPSITQEIHCSLKRSGYDCVASSRNNDIISKLEKEGRLRDLVNYPVRHDVQIGKKFKSVIVKGGNSDIYAIDGSKSISVTIPAGKNIACDMMGGISNRILLHCTVVDEKSIPCSWDHKKCKILKSDEKSEWSIDKLIMLEKQLRK